MCVCVCVVAEIGDVLLRSPDESTYQLKQEIASLREERDIIIHENKELRSENERIKSQLLTMTIKEKGTFSVAHLHCYLLTCFV